MKRFVGICLLCGLLSVTTAAEISFDPASGSFGNDCVVPVKIMIDTFDKTISATDIVLESSMEFVDFVPSNALPYFLPPKIDGSVVHIVGFAVQEDQRFRGKSTLGTIYLKQRNISDRDGSIKLYFTRYGDTTDTNLSVPGGVDVLDKVSDGFYSFDSDKSCKHKSSQIKGGIMTDNYDKSLEKLKVKIDKKPDIGTKLWNVYYIIGLIMLIILMGMFLFTKYRRGKRD